MDVRYTLTTTAAPVQAEGTVNGRPFYFRSRWDGWTFAVAEEPGLDPAELDDSGADDRGWVRNGRFADRYKASHLSAAEADAIIRACAAAYIAERAS